LKGTNSLAGYSLNQTVFFFLTFNIIDVISQFLFREAYRFRPLIVSGDFDLVMTKPMSALFRVLMGGSDFIDFLTIPPLIFALFYVGRMLHPSGIQLLFYVLLIANGLLIATAFYITVLAFGIITLEVDHTIMIYRDITNLGRFPIDIYKEPLKGILTYLIPVGTMMTLPVKAFIGLVTIKGVLSSFLLGFLVLTISLKFWNHALKSYTSASS
jgi:ABC-2 type transport system permease protein